MHDATRLGIVLGLGIDDGVDCLLDRIHEVVGDAVRPDHPNRLVVRQRVCSELLADLDHLLAVAGHRLYRIVDHAEHCRIVLVKGAQLVEMGGERSLMLVDALEVVVVAREQIAAIRILDPCQRQPRREGGGRRSPGLLLQDLGPFDVGQIQERGTVHRQDDRTDGEV